VVVAVFVPVPGEPVSAVGIDAGPTWAVWAVIGVVVVAVVTVFAGHGVDVAVSADAERAVVVAGSGILRVVVTFFGSRKNVPGKSVTAGSGMTASVGTGGAGIMDVAVAVVTGFGTGQEKSIAAEGCLAGASRTVGAVVVVVVVPVVAGFTIGPAVFRPGDSVTTSRPLASSPGTIRAAVVQVMDAVVPVVAGFDSRPDEPVAAGGVFAGGTHTVGTCIAVVIVPVVTLFPGIHLAVAAVFSLTAGGTTVPVVEVSIVAGLTLGTAVQSPLEPVAATSRLARALWARWACVVEIVVSVVAGLSFVDLAVAAGLELTVRVAPITIGQVPVIAGFVEPGGVVDHIVTADWEGAVGATGIWGAVRVGRGIVAFFAIEGVYDAVSAGRFGAVSAASIRGGVGVLVALVAIFPVEGVTDAITANRKGAVGAAGIGNGVGE